MHAENKAFVGIDCGMRYLKFALFDPTSRRVEIVRDESNYPAVIYMPESDKEHVLVGPSAELALDDDRKRIHVAQNLKTLLAKSSSNVVLGDGRELPIVDVLSHAFSYIKRLVEKRLEREVTHCVLTYPDVETLFNDRAKRRLLRAAEQSGFEVNLLTEPEAAGIAMQHELPESVRSTIVLCDIGHSTTDLAQLVRADSDSPFQIQRTRSIPVGGVNFDRILYHHFDGLCREQKGRPISSQPRKMDSAFLRECRRLREALSEQVDFQIKAELANEDGTAEVVRFALSREELESLIANQAMELAEHVTEFVQSEINEENEAWTLMLVGGASRMPTLQQYLARECNKEPVMWGDRDYAVAIGAAYHANSLWGVRDKFRQIIRRLFESHSYTRLSRDDVESIQQQGIDLGLTADEIQTDELAECNGRSLDEHLAEQKKNDVSAYRELLQMIANGSRVEEEQVADARRAAEEHGLTEEEVDEIEHEILDMSLEEKLQETIDADESRRGPTPEADQLFQDAKKLLSNNNLPQARSKVDAAVSIAIATGANEWSAPHYLKSEIYRRLGEWEAADNAGSACLKLEPNNALAMRCRGISRLERGQKTEALDDLSQSIRISSTGAAYAYRAVLQYGTRNIYEDAVADLESAAKQASSCEEHEIPKAAVLAAIAHIRHLKMRRPDLALDDYRRAISEMPNSPSDKFLKQFSAFCRRFDFTYSSSPLIALQQKLLRACQDRISAESTECTRTIMIDFRHHNSKTIDKEVWNGVGSSFPFYLSMLAAENGQDESSYNWMRSVLRHHPRFDICRATADIAICRVAREYSPMKDLLSVDWAWDCNWLTGRVTLTNRSDFDLTGVEVTLTVSKHEGHGDTVRERTTDRVSSGGKATWNNISFGTCGFAGRLIKKKTLHLECNEWSNFR